MEAIKILSTMAAGLIGWLFGSSVALVLSDIAGTSTRRSMIDLTSPAFFACFLAALTLIAANTVMKKD